jgi:hypothetical protein
VIVEKAPKSRLKDLDKVYRVESYLNCNLEGSCKDDKNDNFWLVKMIEAFNKDQTITN